LATGKKGLNMTIIRIVHNKENPFVQLNKAALWDQRLSLKAVGLWSRCLSRPNDWTFNVSELVKKCKEGRRSIDSAIDELIEFGYAVRIDYWDKGKNGKFNDGGSEYVFFEFVATEEDKNKILEEFKKSYRNCCFSNSRKSDCQNDELLIHNPTDIEVKEKLLTTKEEATPQEVVFPCLDQLKLSSSKKKQLSKKYSEEILIDAVKKALAWKGKRSHEAAIETILARIGDWNEAPDKEKIIENNQIYLKSLEARDGVMFGLWRCDILSNRIEFICGSNVKSFKISEPDFIEKVREFMKNKEK